MIMALRSWFSRAPRDKSVTIQPGATAFTLTSSGPYAQARDIVRLRMAPLDAE